MQASIIQIIIAAINSPPHAGIEMCKILPIKSEIPAELGNAHNANAVINAPINK